MSPQQVKVIQMKAMRTPVIKKRENGTENLRHIKRRKRNININVGNHQKTLIVTVIQEKRRREVKDELLFIKRNRDSAVLEHEGSINSCQITA